MEGPRSRVGIRWRPIWRFRQEHVRRPGGRGLGIGYTADMTDGNYSREQVPQDRRLERWLRIAGVVVLALLIGLLVTSLFRAPNPIWTPITALVALVVAGLVVRSFVRRAKAR